MVRDMFPSLTIDFNFLVAQSQIRRFASIQRFTAPLGHYLEQETGFEFEDVCALNAYGDAGLPKQHRREISS